MAQLWTNIQEVICSNPFAAAAWRLLKNSYCRDEDGSHTQRQTHSKPPKTVQLICASAINILFNFFQPFRKESSKGETEVTNLSLSPLLVNNAKLQKSVMISRYIKCVQPSELREN